ncbi:1-phosphofructokinase [Novosphingobium terrae]|uniref:1-phosphofructokinase n=1 Tax=Novosphingobium terrae TaxID=2726189 RepID=UPI001981A86B|nr:1-phosphofructokinase [Novosphingobium terrae]
MTSPKRVATVTFNPAIDQTVTVGHLTRGEVHRAQSVRQDPGGKGVNVASCLADWGVPVTVFGLLGADNAAPFEALCAAKPITDRFERLPGATRVNIKIVDDGETTDINMDGLSVDEAASERVLAAVEAFAAPDALIVLSGSLPPGCDAGIYATMVARLRAAGARVLLDTSGVPLSLALKAAVLPDIVKPNRRELAAWAGEPLDSLADVVRCGQRLRAGGVALVVVSMGEEGALFLSDEGVLLARLSAGDLASTVGAGDAMVAGLAAAAIEGAGLERIARLATAFAVAKLGRPGPHLPDLGTVHALSEDVTITTITATEAIGADGTGEAR